MDKKDLAASIAYCGLVCQLCHLADQCDGCCSTASKCENHSGKWGGCHHRNCCTERKLSGCWECADFPCGQDMFSETHDLRIRAFVSFIQAEGVERLAECLIANAAKGIKYGHRRDYDGLTSEAEVHELLRTGVRKCMDCRQACSGQA